VSWRHLKDSEPVARRDHSCFLCGQQIPAGEQYVRRVGFDDRELVTTTMHTECDVETWDWDQTDWETFSPGELERPRGVEVED